MTLTQLQQEIGKEFKETFELHDLGHDEFTICCNNGNGTCDGGVSVSKENEEEARQHLKKVEKFILQSIEKAWNGGQTEMLDWFNQSVIGWPDSKQRLMVKIKNIEIDELQSLTTKEEE